MTDISIRMCCTPAIVGSPVDLEMAIRPALPSRTNGDNSSVSFLFNAEVPSAAYCDHPPTSTSVPCPPAHPMRVDGHTAANAPPVAPWSASGIAERQRIERSGTAQTSRSTSRPTRFRSTLALSPTTGSPQARNRPGHGPRLEARDSPGRSSAAAIETTPALRSTPPNTPPKPLLKPPPAAS